MRRKTVGEKRAQHFSPADTPVDTLHPIAFIEEGTLAHNGPVVVVLSLSEQRPDAYCKGADIGVATASRGKQGYGTPTRVLTLRNKDRECVHARDTLFPSNPIVKQYPAHDTH